MRTFLSFVCCLWASVCLAGSATFEKLAEVNKCWREQSDVRTEQLGSYQLQDERAWIRLHLSLVEQILRQRSTAHLSAQQAANRQQCLRYLHDYWNAGDFPVNEDYPYRTPIFIDKHDNFCAVGYLVKASGHEEVSRMIASKTNLAYVKQMHYPELNAWAEQYGFTVDELAWIQPGYPPTESCASLGRGVNGSVNEMLADGNTLYVGGAFSRADSTVNAANIAYVTETGGVYTWHSMGNGVNGPVYSMVKYNNKLFVAGEFSQAGDSAATNVAYWDGNRWASAGCTYGRINKLLVFRGELYAAGSFDVCAALSNVNFAKWTGTMWQQIPGLFTPVNTMYATDSAIILGGTFKWNNVDVNVIKWSPEQSFQPFTTGIANEVRDLCLYKDTLYAACRRTATGADSLNLFMKLKGNSWVPQSPQLFSYFTPQQGELSFNTLCVDAGNQLMTGGNFFFRPLIGSWAMNCFNITPNSNENWFAVDDEVRKMVVFKGNLIAGGKFRSSYNYSGPSTLLNGIARKVVSTSVREVAAVHDFSLYPNPAKKGSQLTVKNNFNADNYLLRDLSGRLVSQGTISALQSTQQLGIGNPAAGIYFLELYSKSGIRVVRRFIVE